MINSIIVTAILTVKPCKNPLNTCTIRRLSTLIRGNFIFISTPHNIFGKFWPVGRRTDETDVNRFVRTERTCQQNIRDQQPAVRRTEHSGQWSI
jgi:hypothetical protein